MSFQLREFTSNVAAPPGGGPPSGGLPMLPPEPTSIAETGVGMGFLNDLVLKIVYFYGNITGQQLSEVTKLPYLNVLDKVLEFLANDISIGVVPVQSEIFSTLTDYIDLVGFEEMSPEEGLQTAAEEAQGILDDFWASAS